jgi:hypothetical protein
MTYFYLVAYLLVAPLLVALLSASPAPLSAQLDGDPHSRSASASTGADLRFRLGRLDRCR